MSGVAWFYYQASQPSGSVTLDRVTLDLTYTPNSTRAEGAVFQATCAGCPTTYSGGETPWVSLDTVEFPAGFTVAYSLCIESPIPFLPNGYAPGSSPVTRFCTNVTVPGPYGYGDAIELVVPYHAPAPTEHFSLGMTAVADVYLSG